MLSPAKKLYVKLLFIVVACLCALLLLITFADSSVIPSWSDIGTLFKEEQPTDEDFIRFINVGQGDSILISSNGYNALLDFGNKSDYGSALLDKLEEYGVRELDCVILSHYDNDHIGGGAKIINAIKTHYALIPECSDREQNEFSDFQYALERSDTKVTVAQVGTVVNIGEFELTVIGYYRDEDNNNDSSLVIMAKLGDKKFLFTGDAGENIEKRLISDGLLLDCDVYKASHHGSRNSNSAEFISAASPEYAVISCGANNQYGHPHVEVIDNLESAGAEIYRTDRSGDITFYVEDGEIVPKVEY